MSESDIKFYSGQVASTEYVPGTNPDTTVHCFTSLLYTFLSEVRNRRGNVVGPLSAEQRLSWVKHLLWIPGTTCPKRTHARIRQRMVMSALLYVPQNFSEKSRIEDLCPGNYEAGCITWNVSSVCDFPQFLQENSRHIILIRNPFLANPLKLIIHPPIHRGMVWIQRDFKFVSASLSASQYRNYIRAGRLVDWWTIQDLEGNDYSMTAVQTLHSPG
jgi:hypothetical protein